MSNDAYVLLTACKNEEMFIRLPLESVIAQTVKPKKWVVVSDGSTDRTDDIIREYSTRHSFIHLVSLPSSQERNCASRVFAINGGYKGLGGTNYQFIESLDSDFSLPADYFGCLLGKFRTYDD